MQQRGSDFKIRKVKDGQITRFKSRLNQEENASMYGGGRAAATFDARADRTRPGTQARGSSIALSVVPREASETQMGHHRTSKSGHYIMKSAMQNPGTFLSQVRTIGHKSNTLFSQHSR